MHREDCLPRVGRWVNQFHGSATSDCHCEGWLPFNGTRKDEADRWERPAYLISPRGSVVEALSVCGKGLQRTAWEPLADLGCRVHSMRDVLRDVQCRISALTTAANFVEVLGSAI